ncbi:MAG: ERCC4 domain-containing protein [Acidimicrobiia bacterium]
MERRFVIARNPDPSSTLPYMLRFSIGTREIILKAKETWPRTAKVYCHRADGEWPGDPEVVVDVGLRSAERRGPAIDLVLDRRIENRSQLVFTRLKGGREAIFWQTSRTAKSSRPGVRVPGRRASWLGDLSITIDTRERYPYRFAKQKATTERGPLPIGDYGAYLEDELIALVERKSLPDLARGLSDGSIAFAMAELATYPRAAVVVEDSYSSIFKHQFISGGVLADLLARVQVRYPSVPIVFCDTRPLAEEWTFRFLGAAVAGRVDQPDDPTAPHTWIP